MGGVMPAKSSCFSHPLQFIKTHIFFLKQSARTSSLKTWTSTKSLLSFCGWWPKWVFSRCYIPLPKWAGIDSQATAVPTAGTEACQPITKHTGGQDSFWVSFWYRKPQLQRGIFVSEKTPNFCYCRRTKTRDILSWHNNFDITTSLGNVLTLPY